MKELLKKYKILIIVFIIAIILFAIISVINTSNNPDNVVKKYCDIMVKGNYGDILDIAYFPESEFITKDKIEEGKKVYYEKMKEERNDVISCTFSKANETEEKITYKLTINENSTDTLELDKKTNKVIIKDIYEDDIVTVCKNSTVTVEDKDISKYKQDNSPDAEKFDIYKIVILSNVKYKIKITNPILNDIDSEFSSKIDSNYAKSRITSENCKDGELINYINKMYIEIVDTVINNKDVSPLNQYFIHNNANEFINTCNNKVTSSLKGKKNYDIGWTHTFNAWDKNLDYEKEEIVISYDDENKLSLFFYIGYNYTKKYNMLTEDKNDKIAITLHLTKKDNNWKIEDWSKNL